MSASTLPPPTPAQNVDSLIGASVRKRVSSPLEDTEQQVHFWFVLAGVFDTVQTGFDQGKSAEFGPDVRALLTGTLALGEDLILKMPGRHDIRLVQENIRSKYESWYGPMSEATADHILGEVFGVS